MEARAGPAAYSQMSRRTRGGGTPERPRQLRVAVAEDSYIIRDFLTTTLSASPHTKLVAVCCNGKELRAAIGAWKPEVVVTDIRMPPSGAEEGLRIAAEL